MYTHTYLSALLGITIWPSLVGSEQIAFQLPQAAQSACQLTSYSRKINVGGSITREQAIVKFKRPNSSSSSCIVPVEQSRVDQLSEMSVILGEGKKAEGAGKQLLEVTPKGVDRAA